MESLDHDSLCLYKLLECIPGELKRCRDIYICAYPKFSRAQCEEMLLQLEKETSHLQCWRDSLGDHMPGIIILFSVRSRGARCPRQHVSFMSTCLASIGTVSSGASASAAWPNTAPRAAGF